MTLSAPDLAIWRTAPYSVFFYAAIHNPAVVFQARVNMASVVYPVDTLTFDTVSVGAYTDILEEQLLILGTSAGASDLGRVWVHGDINRVVATATTINISRVSQGRHDGELDVSDDVFISVLDLRTLRSAAPWIDAISSPDDPLTWKDGIIPYSSFNVFQPVPIMGGDRLKIVETSGDTATFDFDCSDSYTTDPAADGTFTPQWDVGDGAIISGGVNTTAITVEYPVAPHDRYIQCQITDNLGHIAIGYRLVMVKDKANADLISKFQITRGTKRADGHDITLRVSSPIPFDTYPDGTEILIVQRERYGDAFTGSLAGQPDAEAQWFSGWLQSEQNTGEATQKGFIARSELTLLDAAGRMKTVPGYPQVVVRESAPLGWTEMQGANIDRYVYWLWRWHSNLITRVDFRWSGTLDDYGFSTLGSDGKSLWEQASERTQAIAYALVCDQNGRLWMRPDPQLAPTAAQVSEFSLTIPARTNTVIVPILTKDWSNYRYTYTRPPRIHWNWGNAIKVTTVDVDTLTDIPTLFCVAPGLSPNQGLGEQTSGAQLAISQEELNCREGNRIAARMNNKYGYLETNIRPGDAGYDPALMQWVTFTIDANTAGPRGRTMAAPNFLPIEVNYNYDAQKGLRKPTLTLEAEDPVGQVAVIDPQPTPNQNQYPPTLPPYSPPPLYQPALGSLVAGNSRIYGINVDGYLYWTYDWQTSSASGGPTWYRVSYGLSDAVIDGVQSAFVKTREILVTVGTNAIYTVDGVGGTLTMTLVKTLRAAITDQSKQFRIIDASFGADFIGVVSHYGNDSGNEGTWYTYSLDGGDTWSTETQITDKFRTGAPFVPWPALFMSSRNPGAALTSAYTTSGSGASSVAKLYQLTSNFSSAAQISSPANYDPHEFLACGIHASWADGENTIYYGRSNEATTPDNARTYRNEGGTITDISPTISTYKGRPILNRSAHSCPIDGQTLLLAATGGGVESAVFMSRNQGATYTKLTSGTTTDINGVEVAGDSNNVGYGWGNSGTMIAIDLLHQAIDDRKGNLSVEFPSIDRFVRIHGEANTWFLKPPSKCLATIFVPS